MKKLLLTILCIFSFCFVNVFADEIVVPEVTDHEKVTIYIFRGQGCSHCFDALTYFNEEASKYSNFFEVKTYEVWYNEKNALLLNAVVEAKKQERGGVPYIVIGENYSKTGFTNEFGEELIAKALEEYQNKEYKDLVSEIAAGVEDEKMTTLREACIEEGIEVDKRDTSSDAIIVIGIFAVVILGGVALVLCSRKK